MENDKLNYKNYETLLNEAVNWLLQKPEIQEIMWKQIRKEYLKQTFKPGIWKTK